jgi:alpha-amylase/alpha-mannosidase (GH57 family)
MKNSSGQFRMNISLLFGIHGHQPVGNFDRVFEYATQRAYEPFIKILKDFPGIKLTVHYTGPLLLWFESRYPKMLDLLGELFERNQLEMVISGFYEPVLAAIPEEDRILQIEKSKEYIKRRFGYTPRGLWLTERVWESEVAPSLLKTGIEYVVVDDIHFLYAGLDKDQLHGYFLTECEGNPLAVFPIDERLRYLIPFRDVEETLEYLKEIDSYEKGNAAIIFDDAEKFGLWPNTHDWVYKKGWLRKFFEEVEGKGIKTLTFSEYLDENPPLGRIYLPSSSYFEMGEWSLPPRKALLFERWVKELRERGIFEKYRSFIKGGIWKNFLVKYSESNRMHKRMVYLSRKIREMKNGEKKERAREYLLRAQCNDAYWHGIFGGLYLPHLRHEVYKNLLRAEKELPESHFEYFDIDNDGKREIYLRRDGMTLLLYPHKGGGIYEFSILSKSYNIVDTLMRRYEHYHEGLSVGDGKDRGEVLSIHEISKEVDRSLMEILHYDDHERGMFLERFIKSDVKLEDLVKNRVKDLGEFYNSPYEFEREGEILSFICKRKINYREGFPVEIKKSYRISGKESLEVNYRVVGEGSGEDLLFGVEINLSLPSGPGIGEIHANGRKIGEIKSMLEGDGISRIHIRDPFPLHISIESNEPVKLFAFPVYTLSQSEAGFDKTYQETCLILSWHLQREFKFENSIKFVVEK